MKPQIFARGLPRAAVAVLACVVCGCAGYSWRPSVPSEMRTVSVPTFRNESNVTELGSVMARQVLREFQREGTFSIRSTDESALEIQGVVKSAGSGASGYNRRSGLRLGSYDFTATVEISVVDKRNGKVLVDNRAYTATTTFTAGQDISTAQRDASGRLAEDLARQVVDDVLALKPGCAGNTKGQEHE